MVVALMEALFLPWQNHNLGSEVVRESYHTRSEPKA